MGITNIDYERVSEHYRNGSAYGIRRERAGEAKENRSGSELVQWRRVLLCAAIFSALVLTKIHMPERFERIQTVAAEQASQSIDYRAVFCAVGKAVGGEETVRQTMNEVCVAVFRPGYRMEATGAPAELPPELEKRAPINALLAETEDFVHCGVWLHEKEENKRKKTEKTEKPQEAAIQEPETKEVKEAVESSFPQKELPEGVCMEQRVLNLSYTTPVRGWLSSPFGLRTHPVTGYEKFHRGLDIAAPEGTAIGAFAAGTVKAVGESSSLGKYIMVSHAENLTTLYAHCSRITAGSGKKVEKGEKIAEVGSTGMATGAHLHFGLQQGKTYLNPIYYVDLEEKPK